MSALFLIKRETRSKDERDDVSRQNRQPNWNLQQQDGTDVMEQKCVWTYHKREIGGSGKKKKRRRRVHISNPVESRHSRSSGNNSISISTHSTSNLESTTTPPFATTHTHTHRPLAVLRKRCEREGKNRANSTTEREPKETASHRVSIGRDSVPALSTWSPLF